MRWYRDPEASGHVSFVDGLLCGFYVAIVLAAVLKWWLVW